jgi:hypothetical protein
LQSFWYVGHKDTDAENQIGNDIGAIGKVYEEEDDAETDGNDSNHLDKATDFLRDQCLTTLCSLCKCGDLADHSIVSGLKDYSSSGTIGASSAEKGNIRAFENVASGFFRNSEELFRFTCE